MLWLATKKLYGEQEFELQFLLHFHLLSVSLLRLCEAPEANMYIASSQEALVDCFKDQMSTYGTLAVLSMQYSIIH